MIFLRLLGFFKFNYLIYLFFFGALIFVLNFFVKVGNLERELESSRKNLAVALESNERLFLTLEALQNEHTRQVEALIKSKNESERVLRRVEDAKRWVYKQNSSGENNITRLFNLMLERLWNENDDKG